MATEPDRDSTRPPDPLRILVVEDDESDFELLAATLSRQQIHCQCRRVETEVAMRVALREHQWDAVISDHHLPAFSSQAALQVQREIAPDLPFIIVSGTIGEDSAVAAMREGADDYLIKGRLARLGGALMNAIEAARSRAHRRAAEAALARSRAELQALSTHLLSAVEAERNAIARDIHDEIGSGLTSLKFDMAFIERNTQSEVAARAAESSAQIAHLMDACQRLIKELRPPVLDAGLDAALRWLVRRFRSSTGIAAEFQCHQKRERLPEALELVCYRATQEALNNVAKHAQARRVQVSLVVGEHELSLEVSDDGIGFDTSTKAGADSFGLQGIRERVRQLDGWLEIDSRHGPDSGQTGTTLILSLPVQDILQPEPEDNP